MILKYKKIFVVIQSNYLHFKNKIFNYIELENLKKSGFKIKILKINSLNTFISINKDKMNQTKKEQIKQISKIREQNNKNWMELLELSFKFAPGEAAEIMKKISKCDMKINKITQKLGEKC